MKNHDQKQSKNQIPNSNLYSLFENLGFTNLTEIQKKASPIILQKKDCLVIAPTKFKKNWQNQGALHYSFTRPKPRCL
jgi:hypothetical protein